MLTKNLDIRKGRDKEKNYEMTAWKIISGGFGQSSNFTVIIT